MTSSGPASPGMRSSARRPRCGSQPSGCSGSPTSSTLPSNPPGIRSHAAGSRRPSFSWRPTRVSPGSARATPWTGSRRTSTSSSTAIHSTSSTTRAYSRRSPSMRAVTGLSRRLSGTWSARLGANRWPRSSEEQQIGSRSTRRPVRSARRESTRNLLCAFGRKAFAPSSSGSSQKDSKRGSPPSPQFGTLSETRWRSWST